MARGQLTIFIILGLALLVIVALAIFFISSPTPPEQTGGISTQEVVSFMESCLNGYAEEALLVAGRQGGKTNLQGLVRNEARPWLADMFSSGPQDVPYWYHLRACESPFGCVESRPPPLCRDGECYFDSSYPNAPRSIQEEVEEYVNQRVHLCVENHALDNFRITQTGNPQTTVIFTSNDVIANLNLQLRITNTETQEESRVNSFSTRLDVNFAEMYLLAHELLELQYITNFVEENFLHFLSVYQGDPPNPPPFSDTDFFAGEKFWSRTQVENHLRDEILPYLNFMQVGNAFRGFSPIIDTMVETDPEYQQYARGLFEYAHIYLPAGAYPDLGVSFLFPYSDIYLNINNREVLRGQDLAGHNFLMKLAGVFIKRYQFNYDVSFPLLTTIDSPDAFGGRGYQFTFAIEGNVVNNRPMYAGRELMMLDTGTSSSFIDVLQTAHHVEDSEVTIRAIDKQFQIPISDIAISYECGWRHVVGSTNEQGEWSGTLPYCPIGGVLHAEGNLDYFPAELGFNNEDPGSHLLEIEMWPFQEKEITVVKRPIPREVFFGNAVGTCEEAEELSWDLEEEYTLFFYNNSVIDSNSTECLEGLCTSQNFQRENNQFALLIMDSHFENEASVLTPLPNVLTFGKDEEQTILSFNDGLTEIENLFAEGVIGQEEYDLLLEQASREQNRLVELSTTQTISLVPGSYSFNALLFYDEDLFIPSERRSTGLFSSTRIPEMNISSWVQSDMEFNVEFTPEQIYGSENIVVHIIELPLPTRWREVERVAEKTSQELMREYPGCYGVFFEPRE